MTTFDLLTVPARPLADVDGVMPAALVPSASWEAKPTGVTYVVGPRHAAHLPHAA